MSIILAISVVANRIVNVWVVDYKDFDPFCGEKEQAQWAGGRICLMLKVILAITVGEKESAVGMEEGVGCG